MLTRFPSWPLFPALVARLAFIRAQLECRKTLETLSDDKAIDQWNLTWMSANAKAKAPTRRAKTYGPTPLQEYLYEFRKEVDLAVSSDERDLSLIPFHTSFDNCVDRVSCKSCPTKPACSLNEDTSKTDLIALSGDSACLSELRSLFETVNNAISAIYKKYSGNTIPVPIVAGIVHNDQTDLNYPFPITGKTTRPSSLGANKTHVDLIVDANNYSQEDYFKTPYILLHEWCCHAYSGEDPGGPNKTAGDSYADGWMDYITFELLKRSIKGELGDDCKLLIPHNIAAEIISAGHLIHLLRLQHSSAPCPSWRYGLGKSAAEKLLALCNEVFRSERSGVEVLLKFSCAMNRSETPHTKRGEFVSAANLCLSAISTPESSSLQTKNTITKALKKFNRDLKWMELLEAFIIERDSIIKRRSQQSDNHRYD